MAGYNGYLPQTYTYTPNLYGGLSTLPATGTASMTANTSGGINWVQGEAGAKAVPVGPGQKALLMDSETNVFYLKSCDTSGMPLPLRIFEYKEVGTNASSMVTSDGRPPSTYVTHEELEQRLQELMGKTENTKEKSNEFDI